MFRRRRKLDDFSAEIQAHLKLETERLQEQGLTHEEAQAAAYRAFGNVTNAQERFYESGRWMWWDQLWQDVRYGMRTLRKSPGFTAVAVLTLALGIGANTAIFSAVNAVLLKPLGFEKPSSLVLVWESRPANGIVHNTIAPPNLFDWERQNRCFSEMAAFLDLPGNLTGAGEPEQVDVESVSPNFFSVLGVSPMLGRGFAADEDQPGKSKAVMLSYGLWKSKFGGDPNVLGHSIELNGQAITVIGVMGPQFDFYINEFSGTHERPQLWAPMEVTPAWHDWSKVGRFLRAIARVKPGVSLAQAQAQMNVIAANLAARYPTYDQGWGVTLTPLRDQLSGTLRPALLILLGAVGLVLLIACANISSLLLSRAVGRHRELAVRMALGASRRRIAQQLLTESLLLGLLGGAVGTVVANWAMKALLHAAPAGLLDFSVISLDWRVFAFAAGVTLFAGVLAGLLPSFLTARHEVAAALPEGGRTSSAGRRSLAARSAFVIAEISLTLVLLTGSGLLIQSFYRLLEVDPGFRPSHLLTFELSLPKSNYHREAVRISFFTELLGRIRALPGVVAASADVTPPFSGEGSATDFTIVGAPPLLPGQSNGTDVRVVAPDYFRTMEIPLLRGRTFDPREFAQQSNVVVINQQFADRYFAGKNPLGQKVVIDMKDTNLPDEIVGVVGNVHESSLAESPDPVAYWPYPEISYPTMTVIVRTSTPPLSLVPAIRDALARIDKDEPMAKIRTMDQLVANSVARSRFTTLLLSAFAALALVLACIGIYGVMAYSFAQRTHEIGIRLALGARRSHALRLVVRQGARLAVIGVGIGLLAALTLTRLLTSLLFGISARDPFTFAGVSLLLFAVTLLACYVPARRALRVDPMIALRYE